MNLRRVLMNLKESELALPYLERQNLCQAYLRKNLAKIHTPLRNLMLAIPQYLNVTQKTQVLRQADLDLLARLAKMAGRKT